MDPRGLPVAGPRGGPVDDHRGAQADHRAVPAETGIRLADATTCAIGTGQVLAATLAAANTLTFFTEDGVTYQVSAVGQLPGTGCS